MSSMWCLLLLNITTSQTLQMQTPIHGRGELFFENEKKLEAIRKRSVTFLTIFGCIVVTLAILFVGFKSSHVQCQDAARELVLPLFIQAQVPNATLLDRILTVLSHTDYNTRFHVKNTNETMIVFTKVVVYDTPNHALAANSLQFVQQHQWSTVAATLIIDNATTYRLRSMSNYMCNGIPPKEVYLNFNSDVDTATRRDYAVVLNGTRQFVRETQLRSKLIAQIPDFNALQTLVPSLHSLRVVGSTPLLPILEVHLRTLSQAPLLDSNGPTSITFVVEQWMSASSPRTPLYWRILIKTSNPQREHAAVELWKSLRSAMVAWEVDEAAIGLSAEL